MKRSLPVAGALLLCVLGPGIAQECADDPAFLDEMNQHCDFWTMAGWDCEQAEEMHMYSPGGERALLEACPETCGLCDVAVDCVGEWSTCGEDCADKTFQVTTEARAGGAECTESDGTTAQCTAGEGACVGTPPPPHAASW